MTDLRQAAQRLIDRIDWEGNSSLDWHEYDALRTALAMHKVSEFAQAQEQAEPVAMTDGAIHAAWSAGYVEGEKVALEQQAEPVAWGVDWGRNGDISCVSIIKKHHDGTIEVVATEYDSKASTPPQRQWVGLTDAEIEYCVSLKHPLAISEEVEAKLKEKNT